MEIYKLFFGFDENTKQCSKCKEGKDKETGFSKDKSKKDGYCSSCKVCINQYHEDNKEHRIEYQKQYNKENEEHLNEKRRQGEQENEEHRKQYRQENKEHKRQYDKQRNNSLVEYNSTIKCRKEIESYEEVAKSPDDNIMCKCAYCGEGFEPIYSQIKSRIGAINGILKGEQKLYCSIQCKDNCPIYNQTLYQKDQKPATSREVQPELRQIVFKRDNYTCQRCNIHKDSLEVGIHCHHIEGILGEPLQSADMDMCITLCEDCHKEVHQIPGCGYNEMKCIE